MSESSLPKSKSPLLSDSIYNLLKPAATTILPAAAALYVALAQIWHFPNPVEVGGSIAAINTFLGVLLGISTKAYNKSDSKYVGDLVVENHPVDESRQIFVAHLNADTDLSSMAEATFRVSDTGSNPIVK